MFSNLVWLNGPLPEKLPPADALDLGFFSRSETELVLHPPANRDLWRKTYYTPELVKDDAPALLKHVPLTAGNITATITLRCSALNQFDQAGLLVRVNSTHWIKFGFEFFDSSMRLSCVVTNSFSDWSTQPWPSTTEASGATIAEARFRVHRVGGTSIALEVSAVSADAKFDMVRIARLHIPKETDEEGGWRVGPFAASPTKAGGCVARFSDFQVGPRQDTAHSTEL